MNLIVRNSSLIIYSLVYFLFAALFFPFYKPLLLASLFAFALVPIVDKIKVMFKIKSESLAVLVSLMILSAFFFIPVTILILKGLAELKDIGSESAGQVQIIDYFQKIGLQFNSVIHDISENLGFQLNKVIDLNSMVSKVSGLVLDFLTQLVKQMPQFVMNYVIFIFALYFVLTHRKHLQKTIQKFNLISHEQQIQLTNIFVKVCFTVLISALIVSATQALIITIAALVTGQEQALIIFVVTFFLAFVPVIGSVPVSASLIIYFAINGQYGSSVIVLIAALVAGVRDNVIRTFMLKGGDNGTHPFVALLSLIGAISLFGFPGLFIGPIVSELAFQINDILNVSNSEKDAVAEAQ